MRAVIQRVTSASVAVDGKVISAIGAGLLVLVGIEPDDTGDDVRYICDKCMALRIFDDDDGKMNLSVEDTVGGILLVSQFTLMGDARKGRRPSYIRAARPETAVPLYEDLRRCFEERGASVKTGEFGADMKVLLENDGPVTILLDSKKTF